MKEGWKEIQLNELCEIFGRIGYRGYTKNDIVESPNDGAITISPSNIINGELCFDKCTYISWQKYEESPEIMIFEGDVILVKTASIGKCALVKELPHKATLNPQFVVFKNLKVNNAFLTYFLKSTTAQNKIQEFASGTAIPTFSQAKLGTLQIPVPSLTEQERIVKKLDEAFAKIDALKQNAEKGLQAVKDLWQATLKEELKPKEGWNLYTLKDCTTIIGDGLHGTPKYTDNGDYYFVNGNNLENGIIEIKDDTKRVDIVEYNKHKVDLNETTVLLSINGTIGKTAFYNGEPVILGKSACYLNVKEVLEKEFLRYFFSSDHFFKFASKNVRQATIMNLGLKEIRSMEIYLPSNKMQKKVVEKLDQCFCLIVNLQKKIEQELAEYESLKQSILRKAFSGEL